jgi:hypothetical protein
MNKITLGLFLAKSKTTINGLLVLFVILLMNTQESWGQGTLSSPIFSENFGTLADATPLTTINSSFSFIRVGTSTTANSIVNRIITKNPSSFTGSSVLIGAKGGSISTIDKTGLSSFNSGVVTFKFKTPSSLTSAVLLGAIGSGASFGSTNGFTGSQLSSAFQVIGTNLQIRASGAWTTVQTVAVSTDYTVAIVFNNTVGSLTYGDKTLASNKCHLWINSLYVGEYSAATSGLAATAFRIYTTTSEFEVDDVAVYNTLPAASTTWTTSWSNGDPTSSLEAIINGTYNTNVGGVQGPFTAKKLTVTSLGSLTINSGTNVTVQNQVINDGTLVVENNANLIQVNNVANTGAITVNRNSSSLLRKDYTLWSSPVAGQNLAAFSPLTSLAPNRFYTYNSASNEYTNTAPAVLDPTATNFSPGAGYLIRMPNENPAILGTSSDYYLGNAAITYNGVFTGIPNNGDVPVSLSTSGVGAYNLVGNPYPSTINLFTLQSNNASVIGNTFYMWRKTNGIGTAYCSYIPTTASTGTYVSNINAQSPATFVGDIQTGQGFFVSALTTGPLVFKNGQRVTTSTSFFKTKQAAASSKIWLNATNVAGDFSQMAVTYFEGATQGVDAFDGKYINDSAFALTSNVNNGEYIIQGRPAFDVTDVVALNFKTDLAGDYTIAIDHSEGVFASDQDIYLVDSKTGTETNLKTSSYTFTAVSGVDNTRFSLKYQKTLKVDEAIFNENNVTVYAKNGSLYVSSGEMAINTIQVYDVQGRLIAERKNVKATTATLDNLKANNQVLLVKVSGENNQVFTKKVVN